MRLSAEAERGAGDGAGLPALAFESFNWHILPAFERLKERAAAGEIARTDFIRGVAALEQLTFAHQLRVLRGHFGELRDAGFADDPSDWVGTPFLSFQVPPSGTHLRTAGYPYEDYGPAYDWGRSQRLIARLTASPGCRPVAGGAAAWEAAVLLDRFRFCPGRQAVCAPASVRRAAASLNEAAAGDPLYYLHRALPHEVRFRLCVWSGGERLAAALRGVAAALAR